MPMISIVTEPITLLAVACGFTTWLVHHRRDLVLRTITRIVPPPEQLPTRIASGVWEKRDQVRARLAELQAGNFLAGLTVGRFMSAPACTVAPGTSRAALEKLMVSRGIRHIPVCGADGVPIGIVSDRDLRTRSGGVAEELMTPEPLSVVRDAYLGEALQTLAEHSIGCLPVMEHGQICGVLSVTDVMLVAGELLSTIEPAPEEIADVEQALESVKERIHA